MPAAGADEPVRPAPAGEPDDPAASLVSGLSLQNSIYRRTMAVCDDLADAALNGAGSVELTKIFAELVGKRIILLDAAFHQRAQEGGRDSSAPLWWDLSDPSVDRLRRALHAQRRPLRIPAVPGSLLERAFLVAPVVVRDEVLGYLLMLDDDATEVNDAEFLTATYAATLFALTMAHERTSVELDQRHRGTVADALVSGHFVDAQDARRKARSAGLPDGEPFRVGLVRTAEPDEAGARELAVRVAGAVPGAIVTVRESDVIVLAAQPLVQQGQPRSESPVESEAAWSRPRITALNELWPVDGRPQPTCGVSELLTEPDQAPTGLRQAEQALQLGLRLDRAGQVICHDQLGIYRLLLTVTDRSELLGFGEGVLGALIAYDARHKVSLVHTLSVYLNCHGSLKQAARTLGLHPNTVAYRTQRIEAMTGLDLADPDDRLAAHVAVKIIETHQGR